MSYPRELSHSQREEALRHAVEKRLPLVASLWMDNRWLLLRSRFLPRDPGGDLLCIEPPCLEASAESERVPVEVAPGAQIGVTFRRGHHKCLFAATVIGRQRVPLTAQVRADALIIRRPINVSQLQRRAFIRAIAPADRPISVSLVPGAWSSMGEPIEKLPSTLMDLSAGGIRIRFDQVVAHTPLVGAPFAIEIHPHGESSLRVDSLYRHCQVDAGNRVSWGLQLVGLESGEERRATLARIARLVRDWQTASDFVESAAATSDIS